MKLKIINLSIENPTRVMASTINFGKSGLITFNKGAVDALKLKPGDKVEFAQDEDRPVDFYLFLSESPDGYELRVKKDSSVLVFSSRCIYGRMLDALKLSDGKSFTLPVAITPLEVPDCPPLFAILTAAAKK
jgi:hypothetical protein